MVETNSISSEPGNKSFDENIRFCDLETHSEINSNNLSTELRLRFHLTSKTCFNPFCNGEGSRWIDIIGTPKDFRDHAVKYCVCEGCYTSLVSDLARFMNFDLSHRHYPFEKRIGDLNKLITCPVNDNRVKPSPKICYKNRCNQFGKYWTYLHICSMIDGNGNEALGWSEPFWICNQCYSLLDNSRKDFLTLFAKLHPSYYTELPDHKEDRTAITPNDWMNLLASIKFRLRGKS